ncbi:GLPGLI family protein [Paraflavitalea sp. CAU 1676]|uniref:GLPGLI family protein n=1 Tax=Paraflavitalea sp. CAU 1676 TaxID=3032598 RepID=UPI0023D98459|nr:GLPGLI family protein [Paraflavitalea sp. CAU 1676]MDF2190933.1 GLPGLI family protein [Paraflavitalea sp. CAU 1676]
MKKIWMGCLAILLIATARAQQTEGKVVYERTMEMVMRFQGMDERIAQQIPRTRTDKFEILFANGKSLRRQLPAEESDEQAFQSAVGDGRQMQVRMMVAGADDVTFTDHLNGTYIDQRELGTKKVLVGDTIRKLSWKLTGDTKTILGYACQAATTQRISTRMMTSMSNGEMKREEIQDTANITAWFTTSIPASVSPEFAGQLPGLVLAIDINNGRTVYKAIEVSPKVDVTAVKEPKEGKRLTPKEFADERSKLMRDMQTGGPGRGATIRFSN